MKKFLSIFFALIMVLAMGTTAFAAEDGSITIRNATIDKDYSVYKVFDLTYSGENVAYTYTAIGASDAFLAALQNTDSPFKLTPLGNDIYSVSSSADAATISDWLTNNRNLLGDPVATQKATGDELTFDLLKYGYYYITSSLGTAVTIDSTLKDVTVLDKNQGPTWDNEDPSNPDGPTPGKVIVNEDGTKTTVNSANFGDIVDFSIAVNATAYVGDKLVTYYYFTDTLGAGFDAPLNIKVYIEGTELTLGTDYTLVTNDNKFDITIPFGEKYGANAKIEIRYSASVNNAAEIAGDGNLNVANFTYDTKETDPDDPDDPKDPEDPDYPGPDPAPGYKTDNEKITTTYVYALGIKKVDTKGNILTGAEFSVKDGNNNVIKANRIADGLYEYSQDGVLVSQFTTDSDGILIIKGLAAGEYSIKEEVAPSGYNLLTAPFTVEATIEGTSTYTTTITTYFDADGNVVNTEENGGSSTATTVSTNVVPLVVVNSSGIELPSTGGIGTKIFYVVGALLMAGAVVLLITKKKMSAKAK